MSIFVSMCLCVYVAMWLCGYVSMPKIILIRNSENILGFEIKAKIACYVNFSIDHSYTKPLPSDHKCKKHRKQENYYHVFFNDLIEIFIILNKTTKLSYFDKDSDDMEISSLKCCALRCKLASACAPPQRQHLSHGS